MSSVSSERKSLSASWELAWSDSRSLLLRTARCFREHSFRGFAVKGTAPESDDHRCTIHAAEWVDREGGIAFVVRANRFLHHMVRFLVGTMLEVASGRRELATMSELLQAHDNREVSPPAPPHALYLERVEYPGELYLTPA